MASATVRKSSPARSAMAIPSAADAICTAPIRLMMSLYAVPAPAGPNRMILSENADSSGRAASRSSGSAPTSTVNAPRAMSSGRPVTGASMKRRCRLAASAASSVAHSCESVEHSTARLPFGRFAAKIPSAPSHTERDAESSAIIVTTAFAPRHASFGVRAKLAPSRTSDSALLEVRL